MKEFTERNEFLIELIGIKIHRDDECYPSNEQRRIIPIDFSTWEGMGLLLTFSKKQIWWGDFISELPILNIDSVTGNAGLVMKDCFDFVEPNNIANAVYRFFNPERITL